MSRPRLSAGQRKSAILESALPLFAARGFAETTTKQIARAAGISEPLLYKHFPSKDALYKEILSYTSSATDPAIKKLQNLEPSTSTLVHLIYFFFRLITSQCQAGKDSWELKHRLMLQSVLGDGAYARLVYAERMAPYLRHMERSIRAGIKSQDITTSPLSAQSSALFTHHVAAWMGMMVLPRSPLIPYPKKGLDLCHEGALFALRGIGLTEKAIRTHFNPTALALFFEVNEPKKIGKK